MEYGELIMSMMETFKSDEYTDGRTKQAFKDQTDINKILAKAATGQTITHLAKHEAAYGDFSDYEDLLTAHGRLQRGQRIFDELPGEVKREFHQDPGRFFAYVNDPENVGRLHELVPGLAKPGTQMPEPRRTPERQMAEPEVPANQPAAQTQEAANAPDSGAQ
jgi:hypothetical protein